MTRHRRAGSRWRLLVHNIAANGMNGVSQHVKSHSNEGNLPRNVGNPDTRARINEIAAQHSVTTVLSGTEFDELVVGRFLHVEQMDTGLWWMDIGGLVVHVRADRDGNPISVTVDLDEERDGVTYELRGDAS